MTDRHDRHVRIVMSAHGQGAVFIDGVEVTDVRRVEVTAGVDETSRVTLELLASSVEFEGVADVTTIAHESRTFVLGEAGCVHG